MSWKELVRGIGQFKTDIAYFAWHKCFRLFKTVPEFTTHHFGPYEALRTIRKHIDQFYDEISITTGHAHL